MSRAIVCLAAFGACIAVLAAEGELPSGIVWDVKKFDEGFKVVSAKFDSQTRSVAWVLEAKADTKVPSFQVRLFDDEDVNFETTYLRRTPRTLNAKKGDRIRVEFGWVAQLDGKIKKAVIDFPMRSKSKK